MVVFNRLSVLIRLSWRLVRLRFSNISDKDYRSRRLLFDNFKYLGGVYVKFLQILSLNVDFLRGWASPAEFEVFEAVDYEPIDLWAMLRTEIPDFEQYFRGINPEPFAAGSFAQVYQAELTDGSPVILKVLRPTLVKNLSFDLRLLGLITRFASWLYPNSVANIAMAYKQFADGTRAETSYRQELSNANWFYKYFEKTPGIVIPRTYAHLSSDRILTQDFIGGMSLVEVLNLQKAGKDAFSMVQAKLGSDMWYQLEVLGTELLTSACLADFVLGDPHPGNIKLLPNNQVGLIDFGIAAPAPQSRQAFLNLIREYQKVYAETFDPSGFTKATVNFFDEDLASALNLVGKIINPLEPINFIDKIGRAAATSLNSQLDNSNIQMLLKRKMMMRLFSQINDHNRFGIKLNLDTTLMMKAVHTYMSMMENIGITGEKYIVVRKAIESTISKVEAQGLAQEPVRPYLQPEQALELVSSWLSQVADSDPFLFQQLTASISL